MGIATVISQCVSVLLVCLRIFRYDWSFRLDFGELVRCRGIIADVTGIGMPPGLRSALISFSKLFVWRYIGGFGPAAMAGVGVAQRLDKFVSMPCKSFGLTITTFVSQNTGAGNYARAAAASKAACCSGWASLGDWASSSTGSPSPAYPSSAPTHRWWRSGRQ